MDERERCERNRVPDDSATPGESATIHYVLKTEPPRVLWRLPGLSYAASETA
jgi:hypothetical protein